MTKNTFDFQVGSLVRVRNRDWVVQPSPDPDVMLLKPMGATEDELTGIYLPFEFEEDNPVSTKFSEPGPQDIGDISSARILYNATRLAFRNGAGPFRCMAKLSFRPRSYQMVPLIMVLRMSTPLRLLIADDVGVGKTIEALLILKEMLERREIRRFAIIVLPHLCEQWQAELKDKFGIDAVIIRSNTQAKLDREIQGDTSVYHYYPYQVLSIDYIKSAQRKQVFIQDCPEFVIIDEAHTCSKTGNANKLSQQQRYALVKELSRKPAQHIVLLTATPHSGKTEEFQSLLSLLHHDYANIDLSSASNEKRKELANHFVQRRRADVEQWLGEETPFPSREQGEIAYELSPLYHEFYKQAVEFALGMTTGVNEKVPQQRMRYWSALALLRGVMSSPAAGVAMLQNRNDKKNSENAYAAENEANPVLDYEFDLEKDPPSTYLIENTDWTTVESQQLHKLAVKLGELRTIQNDNKIAETVKLLKNWINNGYNPVIFCRYIATANYLGSHLKSELPKLFSDIDIQIVTSEEPDEARKARIDSMGKASRRVLVATDCISEGVNLQDKFSAVLHYDLPWNPNRLEQREGRIDRFGQIAKEVKTYLLYGKNNPIDGVVLRVLIKKVREIRRATGISIPFPEDSQSLMDSVLQSVLLDQREQLEGIQTSLDFGEFETTRQTELKVSHAIEEAANREKLSRSIFAHHSIRASEIEIDLKEADEAIGEPKAVEEFVVESLTTMLGTQITKDKKGYILFPENLPGSLRMLLPDGNRIKCTFYSPAPEGYVYIGRNHLFVEHLCQYLTSKAMTKIQKHTPARAAVIRSREIAIKTTILLYRVRSVTQDKETAHQLVAEEVLVWGYEGVAGNKTIVEHDRAIKLLKTLLPSSNMTPESRISFLQQELADIATMRKELDDVANARAEVLVEAHERFRKVLGGSRYKVVEPVLPMDLLGVYIILPDRS